MLTRRTLLRSTLKATGALTFSGSLPGLSIALAQNTPPLRRSLGEMKSTDPDLETYREFVTTMKQRDPNNPVSWVGFADVHGSGQEFNLCPHSNWYFLPWHRGYLRMYEEAVRALTNNPKFALPYWDWTKDRKMPRSFSDEKINGISNPLFVKDRAKNIFDDEIVGKKVMKNIYSALDFEYFGSSRAEFQNDSNPKWIKRQGTAAPLEFTPHNNIHVQVGGPFMPFASSAQDPIFLMHHCNIDRIWAVWNSKGRKNTSEKMWLNMKFKNHFIKPDGTKYTDVVKDLQKVEPLGYTYGLEKATSGSGDASPTRRSTSLFGTNKGREISAFPRYHATPIATMQKPLSMMLPSDVSSKATGSHVPQIYAIIRNLVPTKSHITQLQVFVNCDHIPKDVRVDDPHYVTTIGFFGPGGHREHKSSVLVNLTPALKRLQSDTDQVVVQLLPTSWNLTRVGDVGPVTVEGIEIVVV